MRICTWCVEVKNLLGNSWFIYVTTICLRLALELATVAWCGISGGIFHLFLFLFLSKKRNRGLLILASVTISDLKEAWYIKSTHLPQEYTFKIGNCYMQILVHMHMLVKENFLSFFLFLMISGWESWSRDRNKTQTERQQQILKKIGDLGHSYMTMQCMCIVYIKTHSD